MSDVQLMIFFVVLLQPLHSEKAPPFFNYTIHQALFQPWMARLNGPMGTKCDAILIAPNSTAQASNLVLTPARCVKWLKHDDHHPSRFHVNFGPNKTISVDVELTLYHPLYFDEKGKTNGVYNVALIKLERAIPFNESINTLLLSGLKLRPEFNCYVYIKARRRAPGSPNNLQLIGKAYLRRLQIYGQYYGVALFGNDSDVNVEIGAPLLCEIGNLTVLQGFYHGKIEEPNYPFTEYDVFTAIPRRSKWLKNAISLIESYEMTFYHENLEDYKWRSPLKILFIGELIRRIEIFTGLPAPSTIDKRLEFPSDESTLNPLKFWTEQKIVTKIYRTDNDIFYVGNVTGYTPADDIYHCAVICYAKNPNGGCTYYKTYRRCYFSGSGEELAFQLENSFYFSFAAPPGDEIRHYGFFNTSEHVQYNNPRSSADYNALTYNVSLKSPNWIDYHCVCELGSLNGTFYDYIEMSSACSEWIRNSSKSGTEKEVLDISIHAVPGVKKGFRLKLDFYLNSMSNRLMLPSKKPVPNGELTTVGKKDDAPSLMQYDPAEGSFLSRPHSTPWLVLIVHQKTSDLLCIGALIDGPLNNGTKMNQTRFVLVNKNCSNKSRDGYAVVDFELRIGSLYHQESFIKQVLPIGGRPEVYVLELIDQIQLNNVIQTIGLTAEPPSSKQQKVTNFYGISVHANDVWVKTYDMPLKITRGSKIFQSAPIHSWPFEDEMPEEKHGMIVYHDGNSYTLHSLHGHSGTYYSISSVVKNITEAITGEKKKRPIKKISVQ